MSTTTANTRIQNQIRVVHHRPSKHLDKSNNMRVRERKSKYVGEINEKENPKKENRQTKRVVIVYLNGGNVL